MDSRPDLPRWAAPLAVALTAAGWWLAAGLQPAWWAAWLAPLPLLAWAPRTRARWAALGTFVAFAIGNATLWHYLTAVIRLPLPVVLSVLLLPALLMVPAVLLFRALARRGRLVAAMLSFPLAATGLSWLSAALSPHGTYGHVAYSQMDALPVIQVAALTGLWGVGLVVLLFPAMAAAAIAPVASRAQRLTASCIGAAVIASMLAYGAWRLHDDDAAARVRVGLVSIGQYAEADLSRPRGRQALADYLAQMEALAARGAQVIVAPESSLLLRAQAIPALQALADRHGVRVVIGAEDHSDSARKRNAALAFEPHATAPVPYYKRHLIPGLESRYTPGDARTMLPGTPRTGVAICKDLDFTATGRDHGRLRTQLLLVPAWDFDEDAWMHGRMAILRGVEGGFAMARAARDGHLTLSDDRGRVLAQASSAGIKTPVTVLAEVPLRDTRTLYTRWGDAMGWLSLLAAIALALGLFWKRRSVG